MNKFYKKYWLKPVLFLSLVYLLCVTIGAKSLDAADTFTYSELTTLYDEEIIPQPLEAKLNYLLTNPFIDNSYRSTDPLTFWKSPYLGEFLRVIEWNIERGLEYDALEAAFTSEDKLAAILDEDEFPAGSEKRQKVLEQAKMLRAADVIILNEVDLGMKRTEYRNVAAQLAASLKMNYAFGVEFVELSPIHFGQRMPSADAEENEISELIKVDPQLYKGLHGIAILSRFPLENVRLIPFKTQPYDWYKSEKEKKSLLEKGKRKLSKEIFLEETLREVRRGGRTMLLADIVDSRLPSGRVTIANTHLENRTKSANRVKQLEEVLDAIKDIPHPVVLAGDMNTSSEDLTPTSFKREFMKRYGNPKYLIRKGIGVLLGLTLFEDLVFDGIKIWHNQSDPTVNSIPLFAPNHENKFFTALKKFRFADGGAFDFRGEPSRSTNGKGKTLSTSNERGDKGFITTFQVNRPIKFIGKYKLDWIFVKPPKLTKPNDLDASYYFAPHFGRTLANINEAVEDRISDHRPILVDLPLKEPAINRKRR